MIIKANIRSDIACWSMSRFAFIRRSKSWSCSSWSYHGSCSDSWHVSGYWVWSTCWSENI